MADEYFGMSLAELQEQINQDDAVNAQLDDFMENEVVPAWRENSPTDSGDYVDSIQVTKPAEGGKGQVGALDSVANIIEFGSEDTPEFAPRAKTEAQFNGRRS